VLLGPGSGVLRLAAILSISTATSMEQYFYSHSGSKHTNEPNNLLLLHSYGRIDPIYVPFGRTDPIYVFNTEYSLYFVMNMKSKL